MALTMVLNALLFAHSAWRSRKTDWLYKFKMLLDDNHVRPAVRVIHFAEVWDHQVYYAINPVEFWNYMQYFRNYNMRMLITENGFVSENNAEKEKEYVREVERARKEGFQL